MGFWNDVGTWFTGRNGIYKNDDLVDAAIESLENINGNIATNLDDPLNKAISDLNDVKGMSDYVGTLSQGAFNEITICAEDGIQAMIDQIESKKKDMDAYERGGLVYKTVGTVSMATGKVLDGFVSVFEGIGDAVLTAGNWVGSGIVAAIDPNRTFDEVVNNSWAKKAIEFDVSGTIASPLTNNPIAQKYSLFTADSGAASICKGIGKTAGYMFIGGQIAGFARGASGAASATQVANAGRIANVLQSTTYSTALGAGVSGFGQGTETGLQSGKSFQQANVQGAIEGAVEAGTMLVAGKMGEHAQYRSAVKAGGLEDDAAKAALRDSIKATGGFNNSITRAGLEDGFKAGQVFRESGGGIKGFVKGNVALLKEDAVDVGNGLKSAKTRVSDNFHKTKFYKDADGKALKGDELKQAREAYKAGGEDALPEGVKANRVLSPVKGVAKTGLDVAAVPVKTATKVILPEGTTLTSPTTIKEIPGALGSALKTIGGAAVGEGAGNATALILEEGLGAGTNLIDRKTGAGINSDIAAQQFRTKGQVDAETEDIKPLDDPFNTGGTGNTPTPPSDNNDPTPPSDNNDPTPPSNNNSSDPGDSGDPGYTGPSGDPGDNGGGGADTQFRDPEYTNAPNTSANNTASNTTTPNEATPNTPNTAANIVFQNNSASNTTTPNTSNTPNGATNTTSPNEATPGETIVTPPENTNPDNPTPGATVPAPSGGGTTHTGGGYTGEAGYTNPDDIPPESTESIIEPDDMDVEYDDAADSISSIIDGTGSNFSKLPTNNNAIHGSSSGSAVIPVIAGLSAAAAAGIGAKAYMDRKNNNDNGEDDFEAEEWSGEEDLDIDYNDGVEEEQYLDDDSDYGTDDEVPEKYGARNNDELADMQ